MASILDRIQAVKLKEDSITIPEWDVTLGVRELDAACRVQFGLDATKNPKTATVELIIGNVFDPETGKLVFEHAHRDMLMKKSGAVIDRIATKICEISGLTDKAAKELEKNLQASGDPVSPSPNISI